MLSSSLAAGALALRVSVDTETILFAIQDVFTQGVLGYWLLLAHESASGMLVSNRTFGWNDMLITAVLSTWRDSGPMVSATRELFAFLTKRVRKYSLTFRLDLR